MPCSDSSSSIYLKISTAEKLISFEYAKITCGSEIGASTGLKEFVREKSLPDILHLRFQDVNTAINPPNEETQFVLYMEWEALRSAIGQYLGTEDPDIDKDRCRITSVEQTESGTGVSLVILPPKELPKILPCGLAKKN